MIREREIIDQLPRSEEYQDFETSLLQNDTVVASLKIVRKLRLGRQSCPFLEECRVQSGRHSCAHPVTLFGVASSGVAPGLLSKRRLRRLD